MAMMMCECRILYQNKALCERVTSNLDPLFKLNHKEVSKRVQNIKVKECAEDVMVMLYDD